MGSFPAYLGIVCAPVTTEARGGCVSDPMVANNESQPSTAFTVSIDYIDGAPAFRRTNAPRLPGAANPNARASDLPDPPCVSTDRARRRRAVALRSYEACRSVQAEAACRRRRESRVEERRRHVRRRAGGTVRATRKLQHVTIADMIAYRQAARQKLIERVATFTHRQPDRTRCRAMPTRSPFDPIYHVRIVYKGTATARPC